mmetsp:Transcript_33137/g.80273  ORF Transcript_33137/g.80273 Transcript_33137/m.80273 type:complete len:282 (+) Transcript_33137:302-1147(+)
MAPPAGDRSWGDRRHALSPRWLPGLNGLRNDRAPRPGPSLQTHASRGGAGVPHQRDRCDKLQQAPRAPLRPAAFDPHLGGGSLQRVPQAPVAPPARHPARGGEGDGAPQGWRVGPVRPGGGSRGPPDGPRAAYARRGVYDRPLQQPEAVAPPHGPAVTHHHPDLARDQELHKTQPPAKVAGGPRGEGSVGAAFRQAPRHQQLGGAGAAPGGAGRAHDEGEGEGARRLGVQHAAPAALRGPRRHPYTHFDRLFEVRRAVLAPPRGAGERGEGDVRVPQGEEA